MTRSSLNDAFRPIGAPLRLAAVAAACLTVAGCAGSATKYARGGPHNKYGVSQSPRVIADGQPIPQGGGVYKLGKPYVIAGRTYYPREEPSYDRTGVASWYGSEEHGRLTANGEVFDRMALSAAHPTLPLPCYARVTNVENGRSVMVRVNDRGPYAGDRIIDLSEKAAELLQYSGRGLATVRVQYVAMAKLEGSDQRMLMSSVRGPNDGVSVGQDRNLVAQVEGGAPTRMASADPAPADVSTPSPRFTAAMAAAAPTFASTQPRLGAIGAPQQRYVTAAAHLPPVAAAGRPAPIASENDDYDVQAGVGGPLLLAPGRAAPDDDDDEPQSYSARETPQFRPTLRPTTANSYAATEPDQRIAKASSAFAGLDQGASFAAIASANRDTVFDLGVHRSQAEIDKLTAVMRHFGAVEAKPLIGAGADSLTDLRLSVPGIAPTSAILAAARSLGVADAHILR